MTNIIQLTFPAATLVRDQPTPVSNEDIADGLSDEKLALLEAAYHSAALIASEDPSRPTPEEQDDLDALRLFKSRLLRR